MKMSNDKTCGLSTLFYQLIEQTKPLAFYIISDYFMAKRIKNYVNFTHESQQYFSSLRDALAPFLKNEEERQTSESHAVNMAPFQYILCAATSPAVKHQEETLTYLNQGR